MPPSDSANQVDEPQTDANKVAIGDLMKFMVPVEQAKPSKQPSTPKVKRSQYEINKEAETLKSIRHDNDGKSLENEALKGKIFRDANNHSLFWVFRCLLSIFAVLNVAAWQAAILVIIIMQGHCPNSKIEKEVLLALITTTTVNVFGFLLIVMKFVFNTGEKDKPASA